MSAPLFDVLIFEIATGEVVSVIGTNMRKSSASGHNCAETRQLTGLQRINENYDCDIFPAGKFKKGDNCK